MCRAVGRPLDEEMIKMHCQGVFYVCVCVCVFKSKAHIYTHSHSQRLSVLGTNDHLSCREMRTQLLANFISGVVSFAKKNLGRFIHHDTYYSFDWSYNYSSVCSARLCPVGLTRSY